MNFDPKSEQELLEELVVPAGRYPYEVYKAEDTVSKKTGNEMIKLHIKFWDNKGKVHNVFDYLLSSMMFKLIHFAETTGLGDKYKSGNLEASDCIGKAGICEIVIQQADDKFPMRNAVKDYVADAGIKKPEKVEEDFVDSDIPF